MPDFIPTDRLIEITERDPLIVAMAATGRLTDGAWADSGTYVWELLHWGAPGYMGIGDPARAARIASGLVERDMAGEQRRASLPRGWLDHVESTLNIEPQQDWDWFWTVSAPDSGQHDDGAHWLTDDDEPDVRKVLNDAMPGASAQPGDERVQRWAGIRDESGDLVACLADTSASERIGHLASVVTATHHQGNGFGAALTSWVTRQMLGEGAEMVTLGMYADNHRARRLYERLGFTCAHRFSAAWVTTDQLARTDHAAS